MTSVSVRGTSGICANMGAMILSKLSAPREIRIVRGFDLLLKFSGPIRPGVIGVFGLDVDSNVPLGMLVCDISNQLLPSSVSLSQ